MGHADRLAATPTARCNCHPPRRVSPQDGPDDYAQEILHGGIRNGVQLDPVLHMLAALQDRFAALGEEARLASMTEMLAFPRRPGETISALFARYEIVRQRAAIEGQFVVSVEGCALQLLRACNIHPNQLMLLLQPFAGMMPTTEPQFNQLVQQLRRHGHVAEGTHGNIATVLSGPLRQARPNAYFAEEQAEQAEWISPNPASHTYLSNSTGGRDSYPAATEPLVSWAAGGSGYTEPGSSAWPGPVSAFPATAEEEEDIDADSATSSDTGNEELPEIPGLDNMSQVDAAELIYF